MFRIAIALLLASAYFSPARALTVDLWNQVERDVLNLVNQDRTNLGLGTLAGDSRLHGAARGHSLDMATNDFFDHVGTGGTTAGQRAQAAGYAWTAIGENIAAGYDTAAGVFAGWLGSDGHRENMRNAGFTDVGIGFAPGPAGNAFDAYWTMVLAAGDSADGEPIVALPPLAGPAAQIGTPVFQQVALAEVAAVPLPPSFWLFVAALAAGLLLQRRRDS